ncbi:ABC-type Fe3+ transport system, permease component [Saccharomonospora marina XMU15]|uniref:ABC-type Fe3+ transport system, permease component n=1 Tax=Saccharomonospora marina XMU15 TaxID=882083 RepID=H5X7E6_9PSEU|nr:iron ABC transporter permease [Saccharomonospora marina]EHR50165.1 ABC-type Fe3+ transport system, permease component [Saccharomonospora marina XMU15]
MVTLATPETSQPRETRAPGHRALVALVVVILTVLVFLPTALVFVRAISEDPRDPLSTFTLEALAESYGSMEIWKILAQTMAMSLGCGLLATVIGSALAWIVARTDVPMRRLLELIVIAPLFLSPFIGALAFLELGAPNTGLLNQIARDIGLPSWVSIDVMTFEWLIIILALHYVPYGYLLVSGSLQNMDASLEEASHMNGRGTLQTALRISLPAIRHAMLSSVMFITISATGMFSVPALLGAKMDFRPLAVTVYHATNGYPSDYALAAALGTMLVLLSVIGLWLYQRSLRQSSKFVTVTGRSQNRKKVKLGNGRYVVVFLLVLYALVTTVLPYAALGLRAFSTSTNLSEINFTTKIFTDVLSTPELNNALVNTVLVSAVTAIGAVAVGLLTSYVTERVRHKGSGLLNSIAMSPLAVPGIVFATGVFVMYLGTPLYGTLAIMVVAYIASYLPHATRVTGNGFAQIDKSLEEASRMCGANQARMMSTVLLPLMRPSIAAAIIMVFLFTVREINTAILLYTPDTMLLSILSFNYAQQASLPSAAVVGLLETALMIAWIVVMRVLLRPGNLHNRA